jgi:uncharacterized protein
MTQAKLSPTAGIPLNFANRHGLITGQTGTGKTVSIMRLAEQFSRAQCPVFCVDAKGDIAALSRTNPARMLSPGQTLSVTVSAMGAVLMSRALDLSDTQSGVLEIAFQVATDKGVRLDTLVDLRALLHSLDGAPTAYGNTSRASLAVINRAIFRLENEGGKAFFRAPCFDVATLFDGGTISILQAETLLNQPRVYSAFILFLLNELWNRLPEIGDADKPRLVLFFDESHLLFQALPPVILQRVELMARLIRSKGVGVYFASQSPADIPGIIREQLAHKVTHDRADGVGVATFETLNFQGKPARPVKVRVSMPACPLGPLQADELPQQEQPAAAPDEWQPMGKAETWLLVAVLIGAAAGCFALWSAGAGWIIAAAVLVALAFRKRAPG